MKVLLIGSYHGNNKGDEAIFYSFYNLINKINYKNKLTISTVNEDYFKKQYANISTFNPKSIKKTIEQIIDNEALILGGGGLFFDYSLVDTLKVNGKSQVLYWLLVSWLAKKIKKKVYWIAIGAGPIKTGLSKFLIRKISRKIDIISTRDKESLKVLECIGVSKNIFDSRDIVYNLDLNLIKYSRNEFGKYILIYPRFWKDEEEINYEKHKDLIESLLNKDLRVVLSETNYPKDKFLTEKLKKEFENNKNFKYISTERMNLHQFFSLIKNSYFVVSMRMHANIIASLFNISSYAIEYKTPKIRSLMNDLNLSNNLSSLDSFNPEKIFNALSMIKKDRVNLKKAINEVTSKAKINETILIKALK